MHESGDRGECSGGELEIFVSSEDHSEWEYFEEGGDDSGFCGVTVDSFTKTGVSEVSDGEYAMAEVETMLFEEQGVLEVEVVFLILT